MNINFIRVVGARSTINQPIVLALAEGWRVRWTVLEGWTCLCPADDCEHTGAVAALTDPRVTAIPTTT